jgi:hypothetical protein
MLGHGEGVIVAGVPQHPPFGGRGSPMSTIQRKFIKLALGSCVGAAVAAVGIVASVSGLRNFWLDLGAYAWVAAPYVGFALLTWLSRRHTAASAISVSATAAATLLGTLVYAYDAASGGDWDVRGWDFFTVPVMQWCGCAVLGVLLLCGWIRSRFARCSSAG